jgi:acyl-coenzyme A synthetase/AMP-(fatty) acid ligase/3-hydroxymyristoyl/3-hydroxydecanoyl-(acyl carrier protein) dehydratase
MSAARRYALLGARLEQPSELLAVGADRSHSIATFLDDIGRLAARMPEAPGGRASEALIACGDRYAFAVALLASWARGYCAALPPSHHAHALGELAARAALVVHDGEAATGIDLRSVLAGEPVALDAALRERIGVLRAEERAVTLYTSGTTGEPQAVGKTAEQLLGEVEVLAACFGGELSRVLCTLPPRHIYGLLFGLLLPLRAGAAFVSETPLHTDAVLALVERHRADTLVAVPAHLQGLVSIQRGALGTLRRVFTSGAPLRGEVFDDLCQRLGLSVTEVFGSTETGGIAHRGSASAPYRAFDGVEVAAAGDGRMQLRSPRLPPDEPQPRLCEDVIELVGGGSFVHLGRAGDIVKIGGSRVSLSAIERAARSLPNVRDAVVLARPVPSARGHEILLAVAGDGWDAASLRAALHEKLEPIAMPRRYRFVAELPREATGKLRRDNVLALFGGAHAPAAQAIPSKPSLELERLAATFGDTHARFELRVPADLLHFQGHFDGWPVLAGVVQLGLVAVRNVAHAWPALGPLSRVRRLKMKQPIKPDDVLALELKRVVDATAEQQRIDFEITRDGALCTSGSLTFARERTP